MELKKKIAYYPGCSLSGTAGPFGTSIEQVFDHLDLPYAELKDWVCCGSTSAHALDHKLHYALNLRNLALAEAQGFSEIVAPCAACYHRLACANYDFQSNSKLLAEVNKETGLSYSGKIKVKNVLDMLYNDVGVEKIKKLVKKQLTGLTLACYYGCLNTRTPRMEKFDVTEYPVTMDRIVQALGARTVDWSYKTECCGASLFIAREKISAELVSKILRDVEQHKANAIAVACPMCHNNLDTKQADIRKRYSIETSFPVLFISQLMGLAFGISSEKLKIAEHFVPFKIS